MNASSYDNYFGSSVRERAENMASSEWNLQTRMPQRTVRGPAFRDLPETLEMTYDINQQLSEEEESEEEESEEEESEEESEEEESEEEESEEEEEENFELKFDTDRHRFMEKFSDISSRRDSSKVVWCLSQHYELDYNAYPTLYFIQLNGTLRKLRQRYIRLSAVSCSCPYFEKGNSPCKHMLLFDILYADFRGSVRRSTRDTSAPDRLRY